MQKGSLRLGRSALFRCRSRTCLAERWKPVQGTASIIALQRFAKFGRCLLEFISELRLIKRSYVRFGDPNVCLIMHNSFSNRHEIADGLRSLLCTHTSLLGLTIILSSRISLKHSKNHKGKPSSPGIVVPVPHVVTGAQSATASFSLISSID
jgi:hypothetical protein